MSTEHAANVVSQLTGIPYPGVLRGAVYCAMHQLTGTEAVLNTWRTMLNKDIDPDALTRIINGWADIEKPPPGAPETLFGMPVVYSGEIKTPFVVFGEYTGRARPLIVLDDE